MNQPTTTFYSIDRMDICCRFTFKHHHAYAGFSHAELFHHRETYFYRSMEPLCHYTKTLRRIQNITNQATVPERKDYWSIDTTDLCNSLETGEKAFLSLKSTIVPAIEFHLRIRLSMILIPTLANLRNPAKTIPNPTNAVCSIRSTKSREGFS